MIEFNSGLGGRTEDFGRQAVDAMGELDTNTWIEASRSYVRLRRRYWRCWLGMPASLVVLVALIPVFGHTLKNPYVRGALFSLLIVAWCACWLGCAVTWFALMGFRCPRCGKRFLISWWSSRPSNRCKHCDLDLGPAAIVSAKSTAGVDL